ncbi:hypothetical protein FRB97_004404 [Tulasnella sp. 331]|nr:hypothetical protein FRB98_003478 [Tulasnella sp. 332]KAG8884395.1 hypothetical protein FRB97_004404 [Tulasnella sp. 331]
MSKPADSTYYIINRVLSPTGEKLVITYNGQNQAATVTPMAANDAKQQWKIQDYDANTQYVIPVSHPNEQAAWGAGFMTVLPAGGYVWNIRSSDGGYTIHDGGVTNVWGVLTANGGQSVTISHDGPREGQRWIFQKV